MSERREDKHSFHKKLLLKWKGDENIVRKVQSTDGCV